MIRSETMKNKLLSYMGFARKSGNLVSGSNTCSITMKKGKVKLLLIAEDASDNTKDKMTSEAKARGVCVMIYGDGEEMSHAVGESGRTVFGITDGNFAHVIKEEIEKA